MRRVGDLVSFVQRLTIFVKRHHAKRTNGRLTKQTVVSLQKIDIGSRLRPSALATNENAAKVDIEQDDTIGRAIRRAIEQRHEFVFDHDMVSGTRHRPTTAATASKQTSLGVCGSESCPTVRWRLRAAA